MNLKNKPNQFEDEQSQPETSKTPEKKQPPLRGLTEREQKALDNQETTIEKLAAERKNLLTQAEQELENYKNSEVVDINDYREIQQKLNSTDSPEETENIIEEIKTLSKESQEMDPNDPKLLELQKKFENVCRENQKYIGEKQLPGFIKWFEEERMSQPNVKHLKNLIDRLKGTIPDKNGLAPRKELYDNLESIFQRNELTDPQKSDYIKKEGLSERTRFYKNALALEKHLRIQKKVGFYSKKMIRETMQQVLTAPNPEKQEAILELAKKISGKEDKAFTYLDSEMSVGGKSIRKMSKKSKKLYLDYYKDTNFNERSDLVDHWKDIVENEGELARELEEIYGNDKDGLKIALESFESLDFVSKEKALKEHTKLVKSNLDKAEKEKTLTIKAAEAKIAEDSDILGKRDAKKYKDWFNNEDNFRDKSGKPGDLEALKEAYTRFVAPNPNFESRNIAAYQNKRKNFQNKLQILAETDETLKENDLIKLQQNFDREGWRGRKKVHLKLKERIKKAEDKLKKQKELGVNETEKQEAKESSMEKMQVINAATLHMSENNPKKALTLLMAYDEENPNDSQILFLIETAAKQMRELGTKEETSESFENEIARGMEDLSQSDKDIADEFEEQQITTLNLEGVRKSEQRHDNNESAQERAKKESLAQTEGDEIAKELTEDYYEITDKDHILNDDLTGEELDEISMDDIKMTKEERLHAKRRTFEEQSRLIDKTGFSHINFKDKSGKTISSKEAESLQKKDLESLENNLTDQVLEKRQTKNAADKPSGSIMDLQERIAAKRQAKNLVDKKRHERLKDAA